MPEIIRDSSHGNTISVIYLEKEGIYRKISRDSYGRDLLRTESRGLNWYENLLLEKYNVQCPLTGKCWDTDRFTRLDIIKVDGKQVRYTRPLSETHILLSSCIDHYFQLWPDDKKVPCHGDMTLDNVIFRADEAPVFFDWEHFNGGGECWGFDMAYLILSAIVLPKPEFTKFEPKEVSLFLKLWNKLREKGLQSDLAINPVSYFQYIFQSKKHWQDILGNSPKKLFPMWINNIQEEYIYKLIKNGC
jgi:hypothetical protein